jgi:dTDP-4-amino-4,6-dideoxygalactose transaminase
LSNLDHKHSPQNKKNLLIFGQRRKVQSNLNSEQIFPRRYFYPSLNTIKYVNGLKMEVSEDISKRILCLPLNHELSEVALNNITGIINAAL